MPPYFLNILGQITISLTLHILQKRFAELFSYLRKSLLKLIFYGKIEFFVNLSRNSSSSTELRNVQWTLFGGKMLNYFWVTHPNVYYEMNWRIVSFVSQPLLLLLYLAFIDAISKFNQMNSTESIANDYLLVLFSIEMHASNFIESLNWYLHAQTTFESNWKS